MLQTDSDMPEAHFCRSHGDVMNDMSKFHFIHLISSSREPLKVWLSS